MVMDFLTVDLTAVLTAVLYRSSAQKTREETAHEDNLALKKWQIFHKCTKVKIFLYLHSTLLMAASSSNNLYAKQLKM